MFLFLGESACGERSGVCLVYAKEDEQGLAPAVSCRHACQCEVLFLVSETSFHHRSPEVADDAPRCADGLVLVFWLGAFAYKVGGDGVGGAVGAVLVGGVDGVRAHTLDFDASQALLIFNAFFVECLKRDVLDERDAVYLDVVALGSELHTLVLFAADNGADVWPVDAHDAVFHFLVVKQVLLLAQHLFAGQKTFVLLGGQNDSHGVLFDQHAPLAEQLGQQVEQTTQQLAGGRFLVLSLLGVGQAGLVHIFIFAARLPLAKVFAGLLEQFMNPLAALPQQFHVRGKAQVALISEFFSSLYLKFLSHRFGLGWDAHVSARRLFFDKYFGADLSGMSNPNSWQISTCAATNGEQFSQRKKHRGFLLLNLVGNRLLNVPQHPFDRHDFVL